MQFSDSQHLTSPRLSTSRPLHHVEPCMCPTSLPSVLLQPHTCYLCAVSGSQDFITGPFGLLDWVCFLFCCPASSGLSAVPSHPRALPEGVDHVALKAGTSVLSPSPVCSAAYSVSRPSSQSYLLLNSTSLPHPRSINATFSAHADTNTPRPSLGGPISSVAPKFHCSVLTCLPC